MDKKAENLIFYHRALKTASCATLTNYIKTEKMKFLQQFMESLETV